MLYLGLRQLRFICSPQPVYRSWRSEVGPCNKGWLGRLWLLCTCRQCRYVGTDKVVYVQAVPLWRDGQSCVRAGSAVMKGRTKMCTCRQCRYEGTDKDVYVQAMPLWRDGQRCVRAGSAVMKGQSCVRAASPVIKGQNCLRAASPVINGQSCLRRAGSPVINGQSCVRAASPVINGLTKLCTCRQCRYQRTNLCTGSQSRYERTKFRNWAEKLKERFETKSPWFSMTGVFVLISFLCWMKLVLRVLVPLMQRHCISQPVSQSILDCFKWSSG